MFHMSKKRSDISTLLKLLSVDAKSAVLLRVPSLTKIKVRIFTLIHFSKWLCLIHGQLAMSLQREKVGHMQIPIFLSLRHSTMVSFILSATFSATEIPPWRDSAKCQLLRLYSQFSFTKILKALQVLIFAAFWWNVQRQLFKNIFLYRCFFNIDYR